MDLKCLGLPKDKTKALEKLIDYLSWKQKDVLFDELDKVLHDETYKDLDNKVCMLESRLEDLDDKIEFYTEVEHEWLEGKRAAF